MERWGRVSPCLSAFGIALNCSLMKKVFLPLFVSSALSVLAFQPGNLAVCRLGDGAEQAGAGINVGNIVFIDEYTTNGALVSSISIPNTGPEALVMSSGSTADGQLTLSPNGALLC